MVVKEDIASVPEFTILWIIYCKSVVELLYIFHNI